MTSKLALVLTILGVVSNAGLCLCSDGDDHHHAAGASEGHSHPQGLPGGHSHGHEEKRSPSHSHGPSEECSCSGPGSEIMDDSASPLWVLPEASSFTVLIDLEAQPPSLPSPFVLALAERGPPEPPSSPLYLRQHRFNL